MKNTIISAVSATALIASAQGISASGLALSGTNPEQQIAERWQTVTYEFDNKKEQLIAYSALSELAADAIAATEGKDPDVLSWAGIVNATYAGAKGGFGALKLAKNARAQLEKSLQIDPDAAGGGGMTTLGTLYAQVPGWPIAFGNKKTAEKLLEKAALRHPNALVSQYFYGKFLLDQNRKSQAIDVFEKAVQLEPRKRSLLSDGSRLAEMGQLLAALRQTN